MSIELATEGARRLRPATVEGNQRHSATIIADQVERDRRNFPIPGLSPAGSAGFLSATKSVADVGLASAARKRLVVTPEPAITETAAPTVASTEPALSRPDGTQRAKITGPKRTV